MSESNTPTSPETHIIIEMTEEQVYDVLAAVPTNQVLAAIGEGLVVEDLTVAAVRLNRSITNSYVRRDGFLVVTSGIGCPDRICSVQGELGEIEFVMFGDIRTDAGECKIDLTELDYLGGLSPDVATAREIAINILAACDWAERNAPHSE